MSNDLVFDFPVLGVIGTGDSVMWKKFESSETLLAFYKNEMRSLRNRGFLQSNDPNSDFTREVLGAIVDDYSVMELRKLLMKSATTLNKVYDQMFWRFELVLGGEIKVSSTTKLYESAV